MLVTASPKQNLVGWWRLDEVVAAPRADASCANNFLTPLPDAVNRSTTIKRIGNAAAGLFATDGLVRTDAALTIGFPGKSTSPADQQFTFGAFIHPAAAGAGSDMVICKNGSYALYYDYVGSKFAAQLPPAAAIAANSTQAVGRYWCAAVRFNGIEFSLWIDGVKQTAVTAIAAIALNSNPFVIGAQDNAGTNFLNGYVNDAFMFSRALSDDEMKVIPQVGATRYFYPSTGLIAAYRMEEAQGSQRYDWSIGGSHLSENGAVPRSTSVVKRGTSAAGKFTTTPSCLKCQDGDLPALFPWRSIDSAIEWTFGCWLYQTSTTASRVLKKGTAIDLLWGFPAPNFYALQANSAAVTLVSPGSHPLNDWFHFAARWRGEDDDKLDIFINGAIGNGTVMATNAGNATEFVVGAQTVANATPMDGYVDELWVYNRALADQEIRNLYANGIVDTLLPTYGAAGQLFYPLRGHARVKSQPGFPRKGQTRGGSSGGGKRKGSGARW